jgi:hypothetical protein
MYNIKFVNAQQAKLVYHCKNIKEKLHKTNASIWYNKIYIIEKLTPKYNHVAVNGDDQKSKKTQKMQILTTA